jgi:DNA polymerase-1
VLLADGWHLGDLPGTARLDHPRCHPLVEQWPQVMTWRELVRLDPKVPLPSEAHAGGRPTPPLPTAAQMLERIDLW